MHGSKHAFDEHALLNPGKGGADAASCRVWQDALCRRGKADAVRRFAGFFLSPEGRGTGQE